MARVHDQAFEITPGDISEADVTFAGHHDAVASLVYGDADLEKMVKAGTVTFTGDKHAFKRFLTLFPLPAQPSSVAM